MCRLFEDIPFLRRFQQKERDETAQEVAEKKAAAEAKTINENGTAATGASEDQGEGIFGGIGEAAAREATRAKTAKVFKEVRRMSPLCRNTTFFPLFQACPSWSQLWLLVSRGSGYGTGTHS